MEAHLSPTWKLSTEHPASSEDRPVLVDCVTSEAFGPDDLIELYPGHGLALAADGVRMLVKIARLPRANAWFLASSRHGRGRTDKVLGLCVERSRTGTGLGRDLHHRQYRCSLDRMNIRRQKRGSEREGGAK
jgi:hypothetical protein